MSHTGNYSGPPTPSIPVRLTAATITDIITAVNKNTTAAAMTITNETAGAVGVIITYYDGTTNWNVYRKSVPANDTIQITNMPLKLNVGDKIKATAASANALTVTVSMSLTHINQDSMLR